MCTLDSICLGENAWRVLEHCLRAFVWGESGIVLKIRDVVTYLSFSSRKLVQRKWCLHVYILFLNEKENPNKDEIRKCCNLTRMNLSRVRYLLGQVFFFLILGIVLGVHWWMQGLEEYPEICDGRMVKTCKILSQTSDSGCEESCCYTEGFLIILGTL